jgi:sarcosine oxidase subunit beta
MRRTADAVVIGGGAVGASVLYQLTKLGMRDVVLLEKGTLASGSTGASAAIVRQHYSNEVSIRLVMRSVEILKAFPEELDAAPFTPNGWLFLCPPQAGPMFKDNMAQLQRLGVRTDEVSVDEAAGLLPGLNLDGVGYAAYEPDSGYADPVAVVEGFAAGATAKGAEVHTNTPATGLRLAGSRVEAVVTDAGDISTPVAVNAAGPWAAEVGRWAGLDLPLEISREQDVVLRPPTDAPELGLAVSDMVDRIYFRPESNGTILAGTGHPKENEAADPDTYDRNADPSFIEDVSARISLRLPWLQDAEITNGWSGLYTITPDWSMIVDKAPGIDGLYLAVGGSGHSFKLAPAIGQCLAELIANGEATTVDITPLRATRFDEDDQLRSTYGGNRG